MITRYSFSCHLSITQFNCGYIANTPT